MTLKTLEQIVRAAVVIAAVAALQDVSVTAVHVIQHTARTMSRVKGNRTQAVIKQATVNETGHNNDRSFKYGYDELNRLIASRMGLLDDDDVQPTVGYGFLDNGDVQPTSS